MINPRQLSPWLLALALAATPLLAQPEATGNAPSRAATAGKEAADKPTATQKAPAPSEAAPKSAGSSKSSPFDYRSSEQISEDVPVSFPVDI